MKANNYCSYGSSATIKKKKGLNDPISPFGIFFFLHVLLKTPRSGRLLYHLFSLSRPLFSGIIAAHRCCGKLCQRTEKKQIQEKQIQRFLSTPLLLAVVA